MPDRNEIHESITEQLFNGGGDIVSEEFSAAWQAVAEAASISAAANVLLQALASRLADALVEDVVCARNEDELPFLDVPWWSPIPAGTWSLADVTDEPSWDAAR